MENWIAWFGGTGGAALIAMVGFLMKLWSDNRSKALALWEEKLNAWLDSHLLKILINVFQTFVKDLKNTGEWNATAKVKAVELAYSDLLANLPNYLIKYAKKLFPNVEATLKSKIQNFYERNKERINQIKTEAEL
jgi:hypothetical protein